MTENNLLLDTNIHLGMFFATDDSYVYLQDYLMSDNSSWVIIACPCLLEEVEKNILKTHKGIQMYYHHIIHRFDMLKKLKLASEINRLPEGCIISHKNDVPLLRCAIGGNCKVLITKDSRLNVAPACNVKIIDPESFLKDNL